MAKITRPDAALSTGTAQVTGPTQDLAIGNAIQNVGVAVSNRRPGNIDIQAGQALASFATQEINQLSAEMADSLYRKAVNETELALAKGLVQRESEHVDKNGNPTYLRLPKDSVKLLDKTGELIGKRIMHPEAAKKYKQYIEGKRVDVEINAMRKAEAAHKAFQIDTFNAFRNRQLEDTLLEKNPQSRELKLAQLQSNYASLAKNGLISGTEAAKRFDADKEDVRIRQWKQDIEADPVKAKMRLDMQDPRQLDLKVKVYDNIREYAGKAVEKRQNDILVQTRAIKQKFGEQVKLQQDQLNQGQTINPVSLEAMSKIPEMQQEYRELKATNDIMEKFVREPNVSREAFLKNINDNAVSESDFRIAQTLTAANVAIEKQLKADPVSFALKNDVVPDVKPIDISQDLGLQLQERETVRSLISARYNVETSGLTQPELGQISRQLEAMSPLERADKMGELVQSMPAKQAETFLADLGKTGNRNTIISGALASQNNLEAATGVSEGAQIRKDKTIPLPADKALIADVLPKLPNYALTEQKTDTLNTVMNLYASYAMRAGVVSEDVNDDIMDRAIKDATNGGPIEHNGINIEPPKNGYTEDDMSGWVEGLSQQDLISLGAPDLTPDIMKDAVLQNVGRGQYYVYYPNSSPKRGQLVIDATGKYFILDFNKQQRQLKIAPNKVD